MLTVIRNENESEVMVSMVGGDISVRLKNFTAVMPRIEAEDLLERLTEVLDANP
jgi:hypothetical protein